MELGVDIVGAAFEWLYAEAFLRKESHQTSGNGCFARAAGGGCYHKCWFHTAKVEKIFGIYACFTKKVVTLQPKIGNLTADAV